jgi:hypothetical protein
MEQSNRSLWLTVSVHVSEVVDLPKTWWLKVANTEKSNETEAENFIFSTASFLGCFSKFVCACNHCCINLDNLLAKTKIGICNN